MSWLGFGGGEQKADAPQQSLGERIAAAAFLEGLLLMAGSNPVALIPLIISSGRGRDPALWALIHERFGNQKAREIQQGVEEGNAKKPAEVAPAPTDAPNAPKDLDLAAFATTFTTRFAKVMGDGFPGGMTAALVPTFFTTEQVKMLQSWFTSNVVPPALFHGASGPALTAQQRILMSGVILAEGTVPPELQSADNLSRDPLRDDKGKEAKDGKHDNKMHAMNCGHWASQVFLYAGANQNIKNNVSFENTDSGGIRHLSNATNTKFVLGKKSDSLTADLQGAQKETDDKRVADGKSSAAFRREEMGEEMFATLQPGDWIYIYNANSDTSGEHSEIFIGWAEEQKTSPGGNPYRLANVMSQLSPKDGGRMHQQKLSTKWEAGGYAPVTSIQRVASDAGELTDVNKLVAADADAKNAAKIASKKLDQGKLREFLVGKASGELSAIKNLDAKQQALIKSAIDGASGDASLHAIAVLIACCQKLDLGRQRTTNGVLDDELLKESSQFKAA